MMTDKMILENISKNCTYYTMANLKECKTDFNTMNFIRKKT